MTSALLPDFTLTLSFGSLSSSQLLTLCPCTPTSGISSRNPHKIYPRCLKMVTCQFPQVWMSHSQTGCPWLCNRGDTIITPLSFTLHYFSSKFFTKWNVFICCFPASLYELEIHWKRIIHCTHSYISRLRTVLNVRLGPETLLFSVGRRVAGRGMSRIEQCHDL